MNRTFTPPARPAGPDVALIRADGPDIPPYVPQEGKISVYILPIDADEAPRRQRELDAERKILLKAFPSGEITQLAHRPDGSPFLEGTDINVSVSHDRCRAVIAFSPAGMETGIDIETTDRTAQLEKTAPRFLSEREALFCLPRTGGAFSFLHPVSTGERFCYLTQAWVTKEALYKLERRPGWELRDIPLPYPMPLPGQGALSPWAVAGDCFLTAYARLEEPDSMMCIAVRYEI